jgi:hypothetical protein
MSRTSPAIIYDTMPKIKTDLQNGVEIYLENYLIQGEEFLLNDLRDYDNLCVEELIESYVPTYNFEVDALWYFHRIEFLDASQYNSTDYIGSIFLYLRQHLYDWYDSNKERIWLEHGYNHV